MSTPHYIRATETAGKAFYLSNIKGPIVMLNLLKFKPIADYTGLEEIAPEHQISGKAAYQIYIDKALPFLKEMGSKVLFKGTTGSFLIGPENQSWDLALLVKHRSKQNFLEFANHKAYLKIAGHRTAAIEDSRLLPISEEKK